MNDSLWVRSELVALAMTASQPVVALESGLLAHGLPYPINMEMVRSLEQQVMTHGATPATIAINAGRIHVGLTAAEMETLADGSAGPLARCSRRNLATVVASGGAGVTTIAGTMVVARLAGISLVATGAIGGVHLGQPFDISPDLTELGRIPLTVVCSGMKPFLDLTNTRERLETNGVTLVGLGTDDLAPYFHEHSGAGVDLVVAEVAEIAEIMQQHQALGLSQALMVIIPVAAEHRIDKTSFMAAVSETIQQAERDGVRGGGTTNYMVRGLAKRLGPRVFAANHKILLENAALGAQIARAHQLLTYAK